MEKNMAFRTRPVEGFFYVRVGKKKSHDIPQFTGYKIH